MGDQLQQWPTTQQLVSGRLSQAARDAGINLLPHLPSISPSLLRPGRRACFSLCHSYDLVLCLSVCCSVATRCAHWKRLARPSLPYPTALASTLHSPSPKSINLSPSSHPHHTQSHLLLRSAPLLRLPCLSPSPLYCSTPSPPSLSLAPFKVSNPRHTPQHNHERRGPL